LTANIPTPTTMRSPLQRRQQVIAIDTNMAAAQGNPVGIMHGSKTGNRNG
jgi:hypothetical protein